MHEASRSLSATAELLVKAWNVKSSEQWLTIFVVLMRNFFVDAK